MPKGHPNGDCPPPHYRVRWTLAEVRAVAAAYHEGGSDNAVFKVHWRSRKAIQAMCHKLRKRARYDSGEYMVAPTVGPGERERLIRMVDPIPWRRAVALGVVLRRGPPNPTGNNGSRWARRDDDSLAVV